MKRLIPLPLLLLLVPALIQPAAAQVSAGNGNGNGAGAGPPSFSPQKGRPTGPKREPAPPALPGARAEPTAVAPADRNASELPPTEALFDAINRGDLPTARDAVNRGADLNGTNVLGLTPLELAVDLGRNEISFLLLSLRGANGFNTTRGPKAPESPPSRAATARAERDAARTAARESRAARDERTTAVAARPGNGPAPQAPRLFAGQGGTPIPQAGFLGFDAGR